MMLVALSRAGVWGKDARLTVEVGGGDTAATRRLLALVPGATVATRCRACPSLLRAPQP